MHIWKSVWGWAPESGTTASKAMCISNFCVRARVCMSLWVRTCEDQGRTSRVPLYSPLPCSLTHALLLNLVLARQPASPSHPPVPSSTAQQVHTQPCPAVYVSDGSWTQVLLVKQLVYLPTEPCLHHLFSFKTASYVAQVVLKLTM